MALKTIQEYLNAKAGYTGTPVKSHQQLINELAGTTGLTKQQAWNVYAGTTGKTIQEAANVKVGNLTSVLKTVQECASLL